MAAEAIYDQPDGEEEPATMSEVSESPVQPEPAAGELLSGEESMPVQALPGEEAPPEATLESVVGEAAPPPTEAEAPPEEVAEVPVVEEAALPPAEAEAPEEAPAAPVKVPWWKRLFRRPRKEAPREAAPTEVAPKVAPPEVAVPEGVALEELFPPVAVTPEVPPAIQPVPEAEVPAAPAFTLDDVRELVRAELARAQEDMARLVQAELARQQQDRRRASLTVAQETAESVYTSKAESIRLEVESLKDEERRTLQDQSRPLRERMEEVDFIRARIAKAEQEIAELEQAATRRVAEAAHMVAELEGRGIVADLRQELERQKRAVAALPALVQQQVMAVRPRGGGLGLWPTVLALILVAAVGVAGVLLPREASPSAQFLIEMATMYPVSYTHLTLPTIYSV